MQRIFHTPEGVRDIYNGECSQKHHLQQEIRHVFDSYGYSEIETPTFEYFEVFSREVGTVPSRNLYNFLTERETLWYYARTLHLPYPEPVLLILTPIRKRLLFPIQVRLLSTVPVIRDV